MLILVSMRKTLNIDTNFLDACRKVLMKKYQNTKECFCKHVHTCFAATDKPK